VRHCWLIEQQCAALLADRGAMCDTASELFRRVESSATGVVTGV
jgi:hypothetical protein